MISFFVYENFSNCKLAFFLISTQKAVVFSANIDVPMEYMLVYQYYQPNHAVFAVDVEVSMDITRSMFMHMPFCPSVGGCREKMQVGTLEGAVSFKFMVPKRREIWIVSLS